MAGEIARVQSVKIELGHLKFSSELTNTIDTWAGKLQHSYQEMSGLLMQGCTDVDTFKRVMDEGEQHKSALARDLNIAKALVNSAKPKPQKKAKAKQAAPAAS